MEKESRRSLMIGTISVRLLAEREEGKSRIIYIHRWG